MNIAKWFFLFLALGITALLWQMISPFLLTLVTAGVVAIIVSPLENKLRQKIGHHRLSSFITIILVFFIVFVPLLFVTILMFDQVLKLITEILESTKVPSSTTLASHPIILLFPTFLQEQILSMDLLTVFKNITLWLAQNIGGITKDALSFTANFFLNTFLFFLALYYFLVDRKKIKNEIVQLSPLQDKDDKVFLKKIVQTVRAVVFGSLVVSVAQGILATIGMAIFGVPGFLIWGALTIVAAQVPLLGVGIIMVPTIAYLAIFGSPLAAIGMTIWAIVVVGLADNFLRPYLIEGRTNMHALLILLSILGALELFGPIGLVIGPSTLAAFLVVVEMYRSGVLEKGK